MPTTRQHSVRFILLGSASLLLNVAASNAAENFWTGTVSSDWNTAGNWSLGFVPTIADNAHIDISGGATTPFRATISADIPQVVDILVSRGGLNPQSPGILNHTAGNAATGTGNWLDVGTNGGSGIYNLADTNSAGGTLTGFGLGSGTMTTRRVYVGGVDFNPAGGTGIVNMNTSGSLNTSNDFLVGVRGGTGTFNLDAGTINTGTGGGWNFIGTEKGAVGSNGTLNMSGGTINNTFAGNRFYVADGNATGRISMTGGTINSDGLMVIGNGNASNGGVTLSGNSALNNNGEIWVGQGGGSTGFLTLNSGTVQVNNWFAVGREGGVGSLNLSGGALTKGGANTNHVVIGSLGGQGTVTQTAGSFSTVGSGGIFLGENNGSTSLWNISGGTVTTDETRVAWNGGTNELRMSGTGSWTTNFLNVGETNNAGKGIVNQTGGTITANQWIAVGLGSGQQSEYNLSGGTTTAAGFEVGADSAGIVRVSGSGVLNATNVIEVPTRNGSGVFEITGGTVNTASFQQGGRDAQVGTGVTSQSGGVVNVSGNLDVQRLNVGTGTYNLSGGSLSVDGAINLNLGTFNFTGGEITRSNAGIITFNGNLTTGTGLATFDLDNNKAFDINGAFNKVAGITLELTGISIPAYDGSGVDTGFFTLGTVDSIVGTFGPATDTITGLSIANPFGATFISELAGEGGTFNPNTQSVYWLQESGGNITLQYSVVPEPGSAALLALAGMAVGLRRRRK